MGSVMLILGYPSNAFYLDNFPNEGVDLFS